MAHDTTYYAGFKAFSDSTLGLLYNSSPPFKVQYHKRLTLFISDQVDLHSCNTYYFNFHLSMRIPEEKLVYSHCSFIFTGTNAEVRKLKKVRHILLLNKASIREFLDEFGLENVSVVAKKLLKEGVFQSLHRAQLRFPDSFQRSEAAEGGGVTVPEAEVVSFETEAAYEALETPEDSRGHSPTDGHDEHDGSLHMITPEELSPRSRRPSAEQRRVVLSATFLRRDHIAQLIHHSDPNTIIHERSLDPLWRLHPTYIPFRTQHRILTFVQSTLETCCWEFGRTWLPHLMKANKWDEPESIELTEWIKQFPKYTKGLPTSATRPIAGKSLNQVLSDTTTLRHRAVHRNSTSVGGIMDMLHAAYDFALALNDSARAALINTIEEQLAASVNILRQDQGLLQQNGFGQLEVTAKGRIELDKLEQLWTINLRGYKDVQRTEAAPAIKDANTHPQRDASHRSLNHAAKNKSTVSAQNTLEDETLQTGRVASLVRHFEHGES